VAVGLLALFGVSVQTGIIMIEYINQLRGRGYNVQEAELLGATLRPITMTTGNSFQFVSTAGAVQRTLPCGPETGMWEITPE
jgi:Cu/Ag efflux pump CusA